MNPTTRPDEGFSITLPVRAAREAQVVTTLAEVDLRAGSSERDFGQGHGLFDQEFYPFTRAFDLLLLALVEEILPDFQPCFSFFWEDADKRQWLELSRQFQEAARQIQFVVPAMAQRQTHALAASPVSTETTEQTDTTRRGGVR